MNQTFFCHPFEYFSSDTVSCADRGSGLLSEGIEFLHENIGGSDRWMHTIGSKFGAHLYCKKEDVEHNFLLDPFE